MPPSTIRRPRLVITVLAASGLVVSLMHTLVVPLLPRFPQLLNTTAATATWLVTATLIAGAVAAPLGRLAYALKFDIRGGKIIAVERIADPARLAALTLHVPFVQAP